MKQISQQLLYQRIRNRVIELLETHQSFADLAEVGAFEAIDMVSDWLPLDYEDAPDVFSEKEKEAVAEFEKLAGAAAGATKENTWEVEWFKNSAEWRRLTKFAKEALVIFGERGRSSEDCEETRSA